MIKIADINYWNESSSDPNLLLESHKSSWWHYIYAKDKLDAIIIKHSDYECEIEKDGLHFKFIKGTNRQLYFGLNTLKYLLKFKPHIIWIHCTRYVLPVILLRFCFPNSKIVMQHHSELPLKGFKKIIQKFGFKKVQAFAFHHREQAKDFLDSNVIKSNKKIIQINEGVISETVTIPISWNKSEKINILWVGRLVEGKQPLLALQVILKLIIQNANCYFDIVYTDSTLFYLVEEELKKFPHLSPHINFIQNLSKQDLFIKYKQSDIIFSTSLYVSSSYEINEALSFGCIPVITNIVGHKGTVNNDIAYYFETGNQKQAIEQLQKAIIICKLIEEKQKCVNWFNKKLSAQAKTLQVCEALTNL